MECRRNHLDRNLFLEAYIGTLGPIDRPHSSRFNKVEQPVGSELFLRERKVPGSRGREMRGGLEEGTSTVVRRQQGLHLCLKIGMTGTQCLEAEDAFRFWQIQYFGQNSFHLLPGHRAHNSTSPCNRRYSHARAMFQSRRTVGSVVPSTTAISLAERPAKKRISTTCDLRISNAASSSMASFKVSK